MEPNTETTRSYIYDLDEHKLLSDSYCLINGIGYEYRVAHSTYDVNCMNAPRNECTFQYTISGEGAVVLGQKVHLLHAGQAFLVEKPGQFRYYVPQPSHHWEFKWLSLNLPTIHYWKELTDHYGRIIHISEECLAMQYWETIYNLARKNAIGDVFLSSAHAYTFIMHLHHDLLGSQRQCPAHEIFQYCLQSIHQRYATPTLSLNTLSEELQVSPSYLSHIFKTHMQESYIKYLTSHRMSTASNLLVSTNLPIETVAAKVGLPDANYFSRVFRKKYGISPSQYRLQGADLARFSAVRAEPCILDSEEED